jgi:hypothetical protein
MKFQRYGGNLQTFKKIGNHSDGYLSVFGKLMRAKSDRPAGKFVNSAVTYIYKS